MPWNTGLKNPRIVPCPVLSCQGSLDPGTPERVAQKNLDKEYVYTLEGSMLQSPASTPIIPTLAIPEQWEGP